MSTSDTTISAEEREIANLLKAEPSNEVHTEPSHKEARKEMWRNYFRTLFIVWFAQFVTAVIFFMIAYANGWTDGFNYGYKDPNGHIEPFNGAKMWEAIGIMTQWGVVIIFVLAFGALVALAIRWVPKTRKPKTDKKH